MTSLASAWAMGRRRPEEHRHKVDAAKRCSGVCPGFIHDLITSAFDYFMYKSSLCTVLSRRYCSVMYKVTMSPW